MGCGLGFGVQIERGAPLAKYNGIRLPQGLPFFFGGLSNVYHMPGPSEDGSRFSLSCWNVCQSIKMGLGRWQRLDDDAIFEGHTDTKRLGKKNQKAITCKNYYNSNNKHNSRLIDPRFKVQIGYLTVNRQTNKQIWAGHHPSAHS